MKIAHFAVICALLAPVPAALAVLPDDPPADAPKKGKGSFAEFERKVRDLVKLQKEAQDLTTKVKGNASASEADMARLRSLQSQISSAVADIANYMEQPQFSAADRAEMQKLWDRLMAEATPTKPGTGGGKKSS